MTDNFFEKKRKELLAQLAQVAKEKGITHDEIAEITGFTRSNVSRMFAGLYSPSLDNFMKLVKAVGCRFFVEDSIL